VASIDVGIHPDPAGIRVEHFHDFRPFSIVRIATDMGRADIFVHNRAVLNALQAALDEIRGDMGRAEQAEMAAKRTARAEEIRADMAQTASAASVPDDTMNCAKCGSWGHRTPAHAAAQTASDQVPTVMADWPAGPPGELAEAFGK
jgi:hypothetical protein